MKQTLTKLMPAPNPDESTFNNWTTPPFDLPGRAMLGHVALLRYWQRQDRARPAEMKGTVS